MGCLALSYYEQRFPTFAGCSVFLLTAKAPDLRLEQAVQRCPKGNRNGSVADIPPRRESCAGSYRFGFNGQEKVNEIAGIGNHTTALFWEYDTRIARRWNLDPKPHIGVSDYSVLGDNPIKNIDPNGDYFFGMIGSTANQRKEARAFAQAHKGTINNLTKKSISVSYTAGYFYTGQEGNGGYVPDLKTQSFNRDGTLFEPTIKEFHPDFYDKWAESESFLGSLSYSTVDGIHVTMQNLFTKSHSHPEVL